MCDIHLHVPVHGGGGGLDNLVFDALLSSVHIFYIWVENAASEMAVCLRL